MNEKEEFNLTLPIILIGLLAIGGVLLVSLFDRENLTTTPILTTDIVEETKDLITQGASPTFFFNAPNRITEGGRALFTWNMDVGGGATCKGETIPEGSDGGWTGTKSNKGEQEVGPIDVNTTYLLDCEEGDTLTRDIELVYVVTPKALFTASSESISSGMAVELVWETINVEGCSLTDGSDTILSEEKSGALLVTPVSGVSDYTLRCTTAGEDLEETVRIEVEA